MTKYYITHVRKDERDNITHVKTRYYQFTLREVIEMIESNKNSFWVEDNGKEIPVRVVDRGGRKYIRTEKDGKPTNNLDELPEF